MRVLRGEQPQSLNERRGKAPKEKAEPPPRAEKAKPAAKPSTSTPAPAPAPELTIAQAVERFIEDSAGRGNAASTVQDKRLKLAHVVAAVGGEPIEGAGEAEASRVRSAMRKQGYSVGYVNAVMRVFSTMLKRCHALRLSSAPAEKLERVRDRQVAAPKAYDDATFEALVEAARKDGPVTLALVLVAGEAALRVGEVQGLEVRDIDLERATLRVERAVSPIVELGPPKNGEARTVPLTPRLVAALAPLVEGRAPGAPVFEGKNGGRLSRPGVRHKLARVQTACGLEVKGLHTLRHTAATSALTSGADVVAVQKFLGHRHLRTTVEAYLHASDDAPQRAVAALVQGRSATAPVVTLLAQTPRTRPTARRRKSKK